MLRAGVVASDAPDGAASADGPAPLQTQVNLSLRLLRVRLCLHHPRYMYRPNVRSPAVAPATETPAQGEAMAVSKEDLETCIKVLRSLQTPEGEVSTAYREPQFKPLRVAMHAFLEDMRGSMFHGQQPDKYQQRKANKRALSDQFVHCVPSSWCWFDCRVLLEVITLQFTSLRLTSGGYA